MSAPRSIPSPGPPDRPAPAPGALGRRVEQLRGARSELRRQLREHKRVRTIAMVMVVALLIGTPLMYLGIQTAARDPVLNSLAALPLPEWAAQSPQDRIISGSRWCFIDCRFRERRLESERDPDDTNRVYVAALEDAGWTRWEVGGCPLVEVDGYYSCWTRDEYTLDLWVHVPACAYDPRKLRPEVPGEEEDGESSPSPSPTPQAGECTGSVVEIKMQNRVADERGLSGRPGAPGRPGPTPPATPTPVTSASASP